MKKRRKNRRGIRQGGQDYWQSYSDMMAALLLMFILIMAAILFQSSKSYQESYKALNDKEKEILDQEETIKNQEEKINETHDQLDKLNRLVGVKAEIIQALKEEFSSSDLTVQIDQKTGDITFDSSILFDYNKSDIKIDGKKFLTSFIPKYISVLLDEKFNKSISEIIIEGHTDTRGDYMYNLNLSQERAYQVAAFCLDTKTSSLNRKQIKALRKIVTANGKSSSNPVKENGKINMAASRRVVFKFRLKDDEMIEQMEEILSK